MRGAAPTERTAVLLVMAAGALWGCVGLFFAMLADLGLTGMQVVAVRVTTAAVCILPIMLARGASTFRVRLRDIWCFVGTGILSLVAFCWCYFMAIEETSLAVAVILMYTSPVFVMLFSIAVFRERINGQKITALIVTLIGCVLVSGVGGDAAISLLGFAYGIGAAVGYSLYSIFGRCAIERGYGPLTISGYTFIFASLGSLPISMLWERADVLATPHGALTALGIGILCCIMPFLLYTKGLAGMDPSKAAILATVEPAVAAIISCVVYGESLLNLKGVGIMLIMASVVILNIRIGGRYK